MRQSTSMLSADFLRQGLSLGQIIAILNAYRRLIITAALLAMLAAGLVSKIVLKKTYDATATVLVDYQVNAPDANREFPSMLAASYMTTQVAFVGSAAVLGPALDELGWVHSAKKVKGYSGPREGLRDYLIWKVLHQNLTISNPKDNRFIYIAYRADSAAEAAKVANTVAEHYVREHGVRLREPARLRAEDYLKSVDALKARFVAAQEALAEFRRRTGLVDLDGGGQLELERMRDINGALLQAEASDRNASIRQQQVSRLRREAGAADVEYAQSPGVVRIRNDLLTAESRLVELQKTLGPRHPDYVAADTLVRDLRQKLTQEVGGYSGGLLDNAHAAARQSSEMVKDLRGRIAEEREKLLTIREQQDEAARLLSDLEAAEKIYKLALDQYGQITRTSETRFNDVSLIAAATQPSRHTRPKATVNILLGFLGGLVSATLMALIWEFSHRRIRCVEDFEIEFGESPLIVIEEVGR